MKETEKMTVASLLRNHNPFTREPELVPFVLPADVGSVAAGGVVYQADAAGTVHVPAQEVPALRERFPAPAADAFGDGRASSAFDEIQRIDGQLEELRTKMQPLADALRPAAEPEAVHRARAEVERLRGELRSASAKRLLGVVKAVEVERLRERIAAEQAIVQHAEEAEAVTKLGRDVLQAQLNALDLDGQALVRRRAALALDALADQAEIAAADLVKAARAMGEARARVQSILELRADAQRAAIASRLLGEEARREVSPETVAYIDVPGFRHLRALGGLDTLVVSLNPRFQGHVAIDVAAIKAELRAGFRQLGLI